MANVQIDPPFSGELTLAEKRRIEIDSMFRTLTDNVYFQAPGDEKMKYPCILYSRSSGLTAFAGNKPYTFNYRYTVTVMSRDPDDRIPERLANQDECCTFDRGYATDGIYHWVFTIY